MKTKLLLFLCILCSKTLVSQKEITISGTITNTRNEPLSYIDILLKDTDSSNLVVAFAITDNFGRFKIIHQTSQNKLTLETSSLIHETKTKILIIEKGTQKFNEKIILNERIEKLDEVIIKASPRITVKNDTTIFNLNKLKDGSERVVEDLIKKLPGIIIKENGRLEFKGKEVGNILLDGDILFDGNYTVGTKNINADYVKGIEAIENFEDNPLLQGLSENDKVALNLKFGDKVSFSGNAELSYANGNRYSTNATTIGISKKLKGFAVASYNTIGNKIGDAQFDATDFIQNIISQNKNGLTAPSYIHKNGNLLPNNNSISNNEFFGSLNILPKLSKTKTLRININAFSDKSLERRESITRISDIDNDTILIEQNNSDLIRPFYFNTNILYKEFISAKKSWSSNFKFSKLRNERELLGLRNAQEQIEDLSFDDLFLLSNTNYTYRINEKSAIKLEGSFLFSEKSENLILSPRINFNTNTILEDIETNNNQITYSKKNRIQLLGTFYKKYRKEDKFNSKFSITHFNNDLKSRLFSENDSINTLNSIDYTVTIPSVRLDYYFKQKKITLRPILNARLYSFSYEDEILVSNINNTSFLLDASFNLSYEIDRNNNITTRIGRYNTLPKEENLYTNFILRSNRVLQNNILNFNTLTSNNLSIFYRYNNLLRDTNIGLGFSYEKGENTYLSNNVINSDISIITNFLEDRQSENRIWNLSFTKYISFLRSTIILTGSHNNSNYFNILNDSNLRFNRSELSNLNLAIGTSFIGKFLFSNNLSYSHNSFSTEGFETLKNEALSNNFEVSYVFDEFFRIDTDIDYVLPNINNKENNTVRLNTSMKLQNKNKTITYSLEGRNLLNQATLGNIRNTDFSTTISSESIFDRLFLFSVNIKY